MVNGYALPWAGGELSFFDHLANGRIDGLPLALAAGLFGREPALFWGRFPSVIAFLASLAAMGIVARPLFKARYTYLAMATLAASWGLPFLGKVANADIWLLASHSWGVLAMIRFLKEPKWGWRLLTYGTLAISLLIQPLCSLLLFFLLPLLLYFLHPTGKRLWSLQPWGVGAGLLALFHLAGWLSWQPPAFYFSFSPVEFSLFTLVAFIPFAPFLVSGLWETVRRFGKGEEWSLIHGSVVLAALVSQALVLHLSLAYLVARQMEVYFLRGFPYRNLVRTVAVLQLILTFFAITALLLLGFGRFSGEGFRAIMAPGALFWMLGFAVVLGLFGMNPRQVKGGMIMAGLLSFVLFWLTAYPLWHTQRQWPLKLVEALDRSGLVSTQTIWVAASPEVRQKVRFYTRTRGLSVRPLPDGLPVGGAQQGEPVYLVDTLRFDNSLTAGGRVISGLGDRLQPLELQLSREAGKEDAATGM